MAGDHLGGRVRSDALRAECAGPGVSGGSHGLGFRV